MDGRRKLAQTSCANGRHQESDKEILFRAAATLFLILLKRPLLPVSTRS